MLPIAVWFHSIKKRYKPLINYKWNTFVDNGVMKLKDSGSKPKYHSEMNSGKGVLFNGTDQSVAIPSDNLEYIDKFTQWSYVVRIDNIANNTRGKLLVPYFCNVSIERSSTNALILTQDDSTLGRIDTDLLESGNYKGTIYIEYFYGKITIYKDGVYLTEYLSPNPSRGIDTLCIGGVSQWSQYSNGTIKDVYVFSDNLTQQEISRYSLNPNGFFQDVQDGVIDNCVLNMPMDGTDATVHDYVNNTDYTISNYTTAARGTTSTLNYGSQELNFLRDGLWRGDISKFLEMNGSAQTGYTPSDIFQIEEVTRTDTVTTHRVYSSDDSKFTNGVSDGTFTVPLEPVVLSNTNIENIVINEYRLFKVHTEPQDPQDLYNKAVQKGLL